MSGLAEAAAFLAGTWPVFPCGDDKRPVTERGFYDAVRDAASARRLFSRAGASLIGVPTGPASGLAVIDLDVKEGRFGLEWLAANQHRIPQTRRHRTRSGGLHLLFRYPAGRRIRNSASKVAPGVDVRGEGGYIIVPPSAGYSLEDDAMPAEMPAWLVDLLDPPQPPPRPVLAAPRPSADAGDGTAYGLAALDRECAAIVGAGEGQKHYALNRAAYSIGGLVAAGELVEGPAFAALSNALDAIRHRCEDQRHAEKTLRQAFEQGMAAPRAVPPPRTTTHTIRVEVVAPPWEPPPYEAVPDHLAGEPDMALDAAGERIDPETGEVLPGRVPTPERKPALRFTDAAWDEQAIPRRPWVAPGYLLRGSVTVAAGVGSAGKSSLMVAWSAAGALGQALGRFQPVRPLRVLTYNVEDDDDEQKRRFSAALRFFGGTPRDLEGRVMRVGPEDIGTLVEHDLMTGKFRMTAAWEDLDALIAEWRPDVVMLDPLAELHTAEENNNTALRHVIAIVRTLARRHDCAAVVVHHFRKGGEAGDMDAIRGAGAIVGAARVALTVTPMSKEEAEEFGITSDLRRRFVRVDNAKANYSPASEADWYELVGHELDNGEEVAAAVPWVPPGRNAPAEKGPSPEVMALMQAAIERGTDQGPYSPRLAPDQPRSVASLMLRHGIERPTAQKAVLTALLRAGFTVGEFRDRHRIRRSGLRAPTGAPKADWLTEEDASE